MSDKYREKQNLVLNLKKKTAISTKDMQTISVLYPASTFS